MRRKEKMYKVSYYIGGDYKLLNKNFETLHEATKFTNSLPINSVLEIRLIKDKKESKPDRT